MIDLFPYSIGFLVYVGFCVMTYDVYSKSQKVPTPLPLYLMYVYYTILAGYVINLVDSEELASVIFIEIAIYAIGCGFFLHYHYKYKFSNDEKFSSKEISF